MLVRIIMKYWSIILTLLLLSCSLWHEHCFAGLLSPEGIIEDTIKDIDSLMNSYRENEQTISAKIKLYNELLREKHSKDEKIKLQKKLIDDQKHLSEVQKETLKEIESKIEDFSFYFAQLQIDKIYSNQLDEEVERYINAVIYYWKKGDKKRMNQYIIKLAETSSTQLQVDIGSADWNILTPIPQRTKYRSMPFWIYYLKMKKNGIDMDPITFFEDNKFVVERRISSRDEKRLSLKKVLLFPKDLLCYIFTLPGKI